MNRRSFIEFLGKGMVAAPVLTSLLSSCTSGGEYLTEAITGISSSARDEVVLADGLQYDLLVKWGDPITASMNFGYNNDYIAFLKDSKRSGLLWVNHESVNPVLDPEYDTDKARLRKKIKQEMEDVGGSIFRIKKSGGSWNIIQDDEANFKLTGSSEIPFEWHDRVAGAEKAMGTLANCSGGVTPWGTILTCEENYDTFYGDYNDLLGTYEASPLQWELFFPRNKTEHYGWVVEYDPSSKTAKKHIGLGRFAHECATVKELPDGRVVIYSGDDMNGGCLYKYVSDEAGKIYPGKLYVGDFSAGQWQAINYERPELKTRFESETQMLIKTRLAAKYVDGTPLDRPEDIEIDPIDGSVIIALTNNKPEENYFGSLMRLKETDGYDGLTFSYETYLTGGEETGFACPDNLAFDPAGNLWFTSDISGSELNLPPYDSFGNNGLFVVPRSGVNAGQVIQMASAPNDAEFTGPCFGPDGELFLSVQHPGETSKGIQYLTSNWPGGTGTIPKPGVIVISGDRLEDFQVAPDQV
ncbi:MAG: DUF839 domain-containing protein [Cytophagales bacterium]|nr:DUF839 domain-containing protein [Cytophagales bacterium]